MALKAKAPARHAELHAVVTRADGTVEDLGCVAYYDRNPFKRAAHWLRRAAKSV